MWISDYFELCRVCVFGLIMRTFWWWLRGKWALCAWVDCCCCLLAHLLGSNTGSIEAAAKSQHLYYHFRVLEMTLVEPKGNFSQSVGCNESLPGQYQRKCMSVAGEFAARAPDVYSHPFIYGVGKS